MSDEQPRDRKQFRNGKDSGRYQDSRGPAAPNGPPAVRQAPLLPKQNGPANPPKWTPPTVSLPQCPLCGKEILDMAAAVSHSHEQGDPAHFECIIKHLSETEILEKNQKIVYLGGGKFGVAEYKDESKPGFKVKRVIIWEKESHKEEWRKAYSIKLRNL